LKIEKEFKMSEFDERLFNLAVFKVPMTNKEVEEIAAPALVIALILGIIIFVIMGFLGAFDKEETIEDNPQAIEETQST
jgi:hypothetical protein